MRYYFELLDEHYKDLGLFVPDASTKQAGINKAKRVMKENGIKNAQLSINSMRTNNLVDIVDIEL